MLLLSIGVEFNKIITVRENILLLGMLLVFLEEEISSKMDKIEFTELGKFIDMLVRTYYSYMFLKLAFSITSILEADIMLIDEVSSVVHQKFKKKSNKKMKN